MTTLINTQQGVIAVVDMMPQFEDWYRDDCNEVRINLITDKSYWLNRKDYKSIIASTFGVGKELKLFVNNEEIDPIESTYEFKPYEYTETETSIIVKL